MNEIVAECPNCGSSINGKERHIGRQVNCPACHQEFVFRVKQAEPDSDLALLDDLGTKESRHVTEQGRGFQRRGKSSFNSTPVNNNLMTCPSCRVQQVAKSAMTCPGCGYQLRMPVKDFTTPAIVTLVLYFVMYLPGLIANLIFLSQANQNRKETNQDPPGRGCLNALAMLFVGLPACIIILIALLMVAGMALR